MSFTINPPGTQNDWEEFVKQTNLARRLMALTPGMQPNLAYEIARQQPTLSAATMANQGQSYATFNPQTNQIEHLPLQEFLSQQAIPQAQQSLNQQYTSPMPIPKPGSFGGQVATPMPAGGMGPVFAPAQPAIPEPQQPEPNYQQRALAEQTMVIEAKRIAGQQSLEEYQQETKAYYDQYLAIVNELKVFQAQKGMGAYESDLTGETETVGIRDSYTVEFTIDDPAMAQQLNVQPGEKVAFDLTADEYEQYLQEQAEVLDLSLALHYMVLQHGYGTDDMLPKDDIGMMGQAVNLLMQLGSLYDWPRRAIGRRVGAMIAYSLVNTTGLGPAARMGLDVPGASWANDINDAMRDGNFRALDDIWENQIAGGAEQLGQIPIFGGAMAAITKGLLDIAIDPFTWLLVGSFSLGRAASMGRMRQIGLTREAAMARAAEAGGTTPFDDALTTTARALDAGTTPAGITLAPGTKLAHLTPGITPAATSDTLAAQAVAAGQRANKLQNAADALGMIDTATSLPGIALFGAARGTGRLGIAGIDAAGRRLGVTGSVVDAGAQTLQNIAREQYINLADLAHRAFNELPAGGKRGAPSFTAGMQTRQNEILNKLIREASGDDDRIASLLPLLYDDEASQNGLFAGLLDTVNFVKVNPREVVGAGSRTAEPGSVVNRGYLIGGMQRFLRQTAADGGTGSLGRELQRPGSRFVVQPQRIDRAGYAGFVAVTYNPEDKAVKVFTIRKGSKKGTFQWKLEDVKRLSEVLNPEDMRPRMVERYDTLLSATAQNRARYLVDLPQYKNAPGKSIVGERVTGGKVGDRVNNGHVVAVNKQNGVRVVMTDDRDLLVEKYVGDGKFEGREYIPASRLATPRIYSDPLYHPWFFGASIKDSFVKELDPDHRARVYGHVGPHLEGGDIGARMKFDGSGVDENYLAEMELAAEIIDAAERTRTPGKDLPAWTAIYQGDDNTGRQGLETWVFGADNTSPVPVISRSADPNAPAARQTMQDFIRRRNKANDTGFMASSEEVMKEYGDGTIDVYRDALLRGDIEAVNPKLTRGAKMRVQNRFRLDRAQIRIDQAYKRAAGEGDLTTAEIDDIIEHGRSHWTRTKLRAGDIAPPSGMERDVLGNLIAPEPRVTFRRGLDEATATVDGLTQEEWVAKRVAGEEITPPTRKATVDQPIVPEAKAKPEKPLAKLTPIEESQARQEWQDLVRSAREEDYDQYLTEMQDPRSLTGANLPEVTTQPHVRGAGPRGVRDLPKPEDNPIQRSVKDSKLRQSVHRVARRVTDVIGERTPVPEQDTDFIEIGMNFTEDSRESVWEAAGRAQRALDEAVTQSARAGFDAGPLIKRFQMIDGAKLNTDGPVPAAAAIGNDTIVVFYDGMDDIYNDDDLVNTFIHEIGHLIHRNGAGDAEFAEAMQKAVGNARESDRVLNMLSPLTRERRSLTDEAEVFATVYETLVRDPLRENIDAIGDDTYRKMVGRTRSRFRRVRGPRPDTQPPSAITPQGRAAVEQAYEEGELLYPPDAQWVEEVIPDEEAKKLRTYTRKAKGKVYKPKRWVLRNKDGSKIQSRIQQEVTGEEGTPYYAPEGQIMQRRFLRSDESEVSSERIIIPQRLKINKIEESVGKRGEDKGKTIRKRIQVTVAPSPDGRPHAIEGEFDDALRTLDGGQDFWTYKDPRTHAWVLFNSPDAAKKHFQQNYVSPERGAARGAELEDLAEEYDLAWREELEDAVMEWEDRAFREEVAWERRVADRESLRAENLRMLDEFEQEQLRLEQEASMRMLDEDEARRRQAGYVTDGPPNEVPEVVRQIEDEIARGTGRMTRLRQGMAGVNERISEDGGMIGRAKDAVFNRSRPQMEFRTEASGPVKNPLNWTIADAWEYTGHVTPEERAAYNQLIDMPGGGKITVLDYMRMRYTQGASQHEVISELIHRAGLVDDPGRIRVLLRGFQGWVRDSVMYPVARGLMPLQVDAITDAAHFAGTGDPMMAGRTLENNLRIIKAGMRRPTFDAQEAAKIQDDIARPARLLIDSFEAHTGISIPRNYSHGALLRFHQANDPDVLIEELSDLAYSTTPERVMGNLGRRFDRFSKSGGRGEHLGRSFGSLIASGRIKAMRTVQDDLKRINGFIENYMLAEQRARMEFEDILRDYAPKMGMSPEDALNTFRNIDPYREATELDPQATQFFDQMFPGNLPISNDDILQAFGGTGHANYLARRWRGLQKDAASYAGKRVDDVMFSYRQTKIDEQLGRVLFFHYWMSRALKLQAGIYFENPIVQANVHRIIDGMSRQAEENPEIPAWYKWSWRVLSGPWGGVAYMNPAAMLVPFAVAQEFSTMVDNPFDESVIDQINNFVFMNPLLQAAFTATGFSDTVPDITGTYATQSIVRFFLNTAKATGWIGDMEPTPDLQDRIVRSVLNGLRTGDGSLGGIVPYPGLGGIGGADERITRPTREDYDHRRIGYYMVEAMKEDGIDPTGAEADEHWIAWSVGDDSNQYYREAYQRWVMDNAFVIAGSRVLPFQYGYQPQEEMNMIARTGGNLMDEETYGMNAVGRFEDLTPGMQQAMEIRTRANTGSPEALDMRLSLGERERELNDPEMQETYASYYDFLYEDAETLRSTWKTDVVHIGPDLVFPLEDWVAMGQDQKQYYLDQWLWNIGQYQRFEQYRNAYQEFNAQDPLLSGYQDYVRLASEDPQAAVNTLTNQSPSFRDWWSQQDHDAEDPYGRVTSMDAFLAQQGARPDIYSSMSSQSYDPTQAPGFGIGAGGVADEGFYAKSFDEMTNEERVMHLYDEISRYNNDYMLYTQAIEQVAPGQGHLWPYGMTETGKAWVEGQLAAMGMEPPNMPRLLSVYVNWLDAKPPGVPGTPEAFVAWYDKEQQKLFGTSSPNRTGPEAMPTAPTSASSGLAGNAVQPLDPVRLPTT